MLDKSIKAVIAKNKKQYKEIFKAIVKYDRIVVFRHQMPDYDALGTQMGLVTWIKQNFLHKEVYAVGDNHISFTPRLYPEMTVLNDEWFEQDFLAIVVDTGNTARIADERFAKAKFIVKIDHHPNVEPYGDVIVVNDELSSCAEIVTNMLLYFNRALTKFAAHYLYSGIAGDSGRFLYSSTSPHTFAVSKMLVEKGFDLSKDVYQKMYQKNIDDLKVTAYVLNNFKVSKGGVAYYVLTEDIQEKLKITPDRGKENVNLFANIEGINAWCSITEDTKKGEWRLSIRSKEVPINGVANMFGGGGHDQAAGGRLKDISELDSLISELDKLFIK